MKFHHCRFLVALFLIVSCSPNAFPNSVTSTESVFPSPQAAFTNTVEPTLEPEHEKVLLDFALSPSGENLAVYLNAGVYVYNVESLDSITLSEFDSTEYYSKLHTGGYYYPPIGSPGALAFSPSGTELAISSKFQDELISIWDWQNKEVIDYVAQYPNGNFVRQLEYAPDGKVLVIRSTYPVSRLQCEVGSEDTITLILLNSRSNIYELSGCNQYSVIEFFFAEENRIDLFHFGSAYYYFKYEVDMQTGDVLDYSEIDGRITGRIYDLTKNGKVFAASDMSTPTDRGFQSFLIDSETNGHLKSVSGQVILLEDANRFMISDSAGQWQLQENNQMLCTFDGFEYLYSKMSRDKNTIAVLTRETSIQIWDIPGCRLINTIPIG